MRPLLLCLWLVWPAWALFTGGDPFPERLALGGWQPALEGGMAAMRDNPALLVSQPGWEFGAARTEVYGLAELPLTSVWGGLADSMRAAGILWRGLSAGDLYREDLLQATAAVRCRAVMLGFSGELAGVRMGDGLGGAWTGDLAAGAVLRPWTWLSVGGSLRQILSSNLGSGGEALERDGAAGIAVNTADRRFAMALALSGKPGHGRPCWQVGQVARPFPWLRLAGGVRLEPLNLAGGFGMDWRGFGLDMSWNGESQLGTQWALAFRWRQP